MVSKPSRLMTQMQNPLCKFALSYEMNLDLRKYERDIYDYFDWLGDIGGISEALYIIGSIFVACICFEPVN